MLIERAERRSVACPQMLKGTYGKRVTVIAGKEITEPTALKQ